MSKRQKKLCVVRGAHKGLSTLNYFATDAFWDAHDA